MNCVTMKVLLTNSGANVNYKGICFRFEKRENSDIFRVRFSYKGVKTFVTVYAPFNWSDSRDLEYLYRKAIKAWREVRDNIACYRKAMRSSFNYRTDDFRCLN